jgi:phenylacetate-CoA ligase
MADLERFYLGLPITLQHLVCSLEGWRIQRTRYSREFYRVLDEFESRSFWPADRIREYRDRRLREFVRHAAVTVPFYRDRFRRAGLDPDRIRTLEDLTALPVLTKAEVQDQSERIRSEAVAAKGLTIAHTSGTTGAGLRFAVTPDAVREQWAVWWRYRRWHGIEPDTWCGYFAGRSVVPVDQARPPFWRYNVPGRQIMFSGYHMSPANLDAYIGELRRRRPPWLHGYPSLLALLAGYIVAEGIDLGYTVRWITLGAENVLPQQVAVIERAFGVRPRQHYGMAEGVANISECERGSLHVDEDFAAVEFIPVEGGSGARVVGCNLSNAATPLLRYDVGDIVTVGGSCGCGRPGRVVEQIDGRSEDYVILSNGARLGRMDHIFKDMTRIREAQIYQAEPGRITFRVVPAPGYGPADESALLAEARKRVGDGAEIEIQYVEAVERSRTGKLRFVVSDIPGARVGGEPPLPGR